MNSMPNGKVNQANYSISLTHVVFFSSFAILLLGSSVLRLAWGITNIVDETTKVLFAFMCAGLLLFLGFHFRVLDRFPRKYPAISTVLSIALLICVAFHDSIQTENVHNRELFIFFSVAAVSEAIYATKNLGLLGLAMCISAAFFCAFITCATHDSNSALTIIMISLVLVTVGIAMKWFSPKRLWIQIIALLTVVIISYFLLQILFPETYYSIWKDLSITPIIPVPNIEWLGANNPILSLDIVKNAKIFGATGSEFPLQEVADWHLFTYIAYQGGWIPFFCGVGVFFTMIVSGFVLAFRHRGLRLYLAVGAMSWTMLVLTGYVLFSIGINYWQIKTAPIFTTNFFGNMIMFLCIGVVLSRRREQQYVDRPSRIKDEQAALRKELPRWTSSFFYNESASPPNVIVWLENVEDIANEIVTFFNPDAQTVHPINVAKLKESLSPNQNCALFKYSGLLSNARKAMYSFSLTREHSFIKFVVSPHTQMEIIIDTMQAYSYGCEIDSDYCIELDSALDKETVEIVGIGI